MTCPVWRDGVRDGERRRGRERVYMDNPEKRIIASLSNKNVWMEKGQRMGKRKRKVEKWRKQVKVQRKRDKRRRRSPKRLKRSF